MLEGKEYIKRHHLRHFTTFQTASSWAKLQSKDKCARLAGDPEVSLGLSGTKTQSGAQGKGDLITGIQ